MSKRGIRKQPTVRECEREVAELHQELARLSKIIEEENEKGDAEFDTREYAEAIDLYNVLSRDNVWAEARLEKAQSREKTRANGWFSTQDLADLWRVDQRTAQRRLRKLSPAVTLERAKGYREGIDGLTRLVTVYQMNGVMGETGRGVGNGREKA